MEDNIIKEVKKSRSYNQLYNLPIKFFSKYLNKNKFELISTVNILILNSTCNGFGDIVFAFKLKRYLEEWYGSSVNVKIATNNYSGFSDLLTEDELDTIIPLKKKPVKTPIKGMRGLYTVTNKRGSSTECNKFNKFEKNDELENFDLYLIAPITADFTPDFKEIHTLVKSSNRFNTVFLTEYNMPLHKDILFNVGVGKKRDGLFLVERPSSRPPLIPRLDYPYSVIYIARNDANLENCYEGYLELLTSKIKIDRLDVVAPPWLSYYISDNIKYLIDVINPHYSTIKKTIHSFNPPTNIVEEVLLKNGNGKGELVFRFDILPLKFDDMTSLYYYSLPIMLLTGDQSFSDGLSIRKDDSLIFYQGLPWKQDFYVNMAKEIPNKFFKSYKTACGNAKALKYKPNLINFAKKNDFRTKAKRKMDALIMSVGYKSPFYTAFKETTLKSKNLKTLKKKLGL